ncbi:Tad domain-containing protein [Mesorhizobium sp. M1004]|uniref:TadE/TadG family type IV pilus assembly protein n=1 Tax=Mesorhizobium sp. M1004 TaxID=2957046 RepID=UPI00333B605D
MRILRDFLRNNEGYVTALTMVAMPLLLGFSLLVIDVGRGNNLHTDLQNAADSLALAGARELDGRADSITRANTALAALVKNRARFSNGGPAVIDQTQISTAYLNAIPPSDDTKIDATWIGAHQTTNGTAAAYLLVRSNPRAMTSLFPLPVGLTLSTLNFQAEAVATMSSAVCNTTPMFICNPYEAAGKSIVDAFAAGDLYSKELRLLKTSSAPGPGNFGLLDSVDGLSLRDAFAIGNAGLCYKSNGVTTKPGVTLGQVNVGLNVRFDVYAGTLNKSNTDPAYRPAMNVRKGAKNPNACNKVQSDDPTKAMGLPASADTDYDSVKGISKNTTWNRSGYWTLNHGTSLPTALQSASRYDVYKYELAHLLVGDKAGQKNGGETGTPHCVANTVTLTPDPDRRTFAAAVVNCTADAGKISGRTELKPSGFVRMFLISPVEKEDSQNNSVKDEDSSNEKPIHVEIVDVAGAGTGGTMDEFVRTESYLVR